MCIRDSLKVIKQEALNFQESQFPVVSVLSSLKLFVLLRQKEHESLIDYTKRFEAAKDVLDSQVGGALVIAKYIKTLPEYDPSNKVLMDQLVENSHERFVACTFIENADCNKYGSFQLDLARQYSLKHYPYPTTLEEAKNALTQQKFDATYKAEKSSTENDTKEEKSEEKPEVAAAFSNAEMRCMCCGKAGHLSLIHI